MGKPFEVDEVHRVIDLHTAIAKKAGQVVAKEFAGSVAYHPIESTLQLYNGHADGLTFEKVVNRFEEVASLSDDEIEALLQK